MNTKLEKMKKLLDRYNINYEKSFDDDGKDFIFVRECDLGDNSYDYGEEPHSFKWRKDIPVSVRNDIVNSSCITFLNCCDCCECAGW